MAGGHLRRLPCYPVGRLAALLFTAVLCLVQPARVRRAASAWKGGKSHRACGEMPGLRIGPAGDGSHA
jgi:hypothetical protein